MFYMKIRHELFHAGPNIRLTKTTDAQNEDALSYHKVRGLYFMAVVFVRGIILHTLAK